MNEKLIKQIKCLGCGRNINIMNKDFCPTCGREIFTPVINKEWNFKIVIIIATTLLLMYLLYLIASPTLYFYLDKV